MNKILIGKKKVQGSYFEIEYTLTLDVPQAMQSVYGETKDVSGVISFPNDTELSVIKTALQTKLTNAQFALNGDNSLDLYGITFDGSVWSV